MKMMGGRGMDFSGSEQGQVAGSYESDNESSGSITRRESKD